MQTEEQQTLLNPNRLSIIDTLRLWWKQPHTFSHYEKFFLMFWSLVLLAAIVLIHEPIVLWTEGRPRLKSTGAALQNDCATMGMGLFNFMLEACVSLKNDTFATFNFNDKRVRTPAYVGAIDYHGGRTPGSTLETVKTWISPWGWTDFFTCSLMNFVLTLMGHAFHGSLHKAQELTRNGFPVLQMTAWAPGPLLNNVTVSPALNLFLIAFCEKIQNGGDNLICDPEGRCEHTNGMEQYGDSFERYAISFGAVYGFFTGLACLALSALLYKKTCTKWDLFKAQKEASVPASSPIQSASPTLSLQSS